VKAATFYFSAEFEIFSLFIISFYDWLEFRTSSAQLILKSPHSRSHRLLCYLFTISNSGLLFSWPCLYLAS